MPTPQWRRANTGPSAWYNLRRANARSTRRPTAFNVPTNIGVHPNPHKEELRELRRDILGPLIEDHIPVVPDGSRQNLLSAFDKRCNYHSSKRVDPGVIRASGDLLDKISPSAWDTLQHDKLLFDEWNSMFDENKQKRHRKAYAHIADATCRDFTDKQIFVKIEALLKRHDPQWAPRIIYQSSDLHNVILGPVMWKCAKRMFASLEHAPHSNVSYMGAYSKDTPQLVERITRHGTPDSVYVESDFSSNDMTQLEDVHLLEIAWLSRFGAPKWITALMHVANKFRATNFKHRVRATVRNQLPTGAQSTTFRNSLWNASINYWFSQRMNCEGDCLILGDDMLMRLDHCKARSRRAIRREYEYVTKLAGMRGEVKVHKHLSQCEFLSKQFVPDGSSFVLVPKLGKAIARFNVRASKNEAITDREYIAGKALSYAYEFRYLRPVSRLFLLKYVDTEVDNPALDALGWNAKGAFLRLGVDGIVAAIDRAHTISRDDMTVFYHWRYGLLISDVISLVAKTLFGDRDLMPGELGFVVSDFV